MRTAKPILGFLISLFAFVVAGCGDNRTPDDLRLDPATLAVDVGEDVTITARHGDVAAADVTWASSDPAVARVTPGSGGTATVRGVAPGSATISATSQGVTATAAVVVSAPMLTAIQITPPTPSLAAGTSLQLTATGVLSNGTTIDLTATATWTSATAAVATVDASGELTGVAVGTSVITATSGAISGTTTATVTAANLIAIDVTPPNPTLADGTMQQLTATGRFSDNTTQNLTSQVTWTSSTATAASVSGGGLVTALAVGSTVVTATRGAISGNVTVTVTAATLASIAVTPTNPTLTRGQTQQFTAIGTFSDGTTQNLTATAIWASSSLATATLAATGLATTVAAGTTTISATSGAITGSTTVTVTAATLVSIAVTPTTPTVPRGQAQQFTATGTFSDTTTSDLTNSVTWASATPAVATISNAAGSRGLATTVTVGSTAITATSGAVVGTAVLNVTAAVLVSIAVTPPNPSVARGLTQQFTATGTFSDLSTLNLTNTVTWTSATPAIATISNAVGTQGRATGVAVGTSVITATSGTISGATTLSVTAAVLVSIAVTPPNPSVPLGLTQQLTATGTFSDTTTANLTTTVTWTSGTPANATVSNADGSRGVATAVAVGSSVITATSGPISGSTTLTVTPAVLSSIAVTPTNPSVARGLTQPFTATGTFSDLTTSNLTTTVTWASATPATATISNADGTRGVATGVAVGSSVITATSGTISGSTTLTVTAAVLSSIQVTPINPSVARGLTRQFTATGTFSDLTTDDLTATVTWASGTPANATISNADASRGVATGVAVGTSVITATSGLISGSTTLTVTAAALTSIQVTPINPTVALGTTPQFTATGTFSDLTTDDVTATVTWASSDEAIATISNAAGSRGQASALSDGTATISATSGSITGATALTVTTATLVSIVVTPADATLPVGLTQQYTAMGTFSDSTTAEVTSTVTWASSGAAATISNATGSVGLATGVSPGTVTISATAGAVTGATTLAVEAVELVSIAVTPASASIANGRTQQYTAIGTFSDLSTQDLTLSATWASSAALVAQISNADGSEGLAQATGVGVASITATSGTVVGTASLTVTNAVLASIAVTPVDATIANGLGQQFTATGTFSDLSTQDLTLTATWASTVTTVAQISNADGSRGFAQSTGLGTTSITATSGTVVGSTSLVVGAPALVSIAVTPATPTVNTGATVQLTATGTFTDTSTQNLTATATWSSLTPATATVNATGLVTGVAAGTAEVRATVGAIFGPSNVTVVLPLPAVAATSPVDGAVHVRTVSALAVTFNLAMDPASLSVQTASGACSGTIQVSADDFVTCIGFTAAAPVMTGTNSIATVTPVAAALRPLTRFRLRVDASVRSAAMVAMGTTFTQATGFLTATDGTCGAGLVISQVYGGGGNSGATFTHDFIELHNAGSTPISLAGHAVQFLNANGSGAWAARPLPAVTVAPGAYFLIQESSTAAVGAPLPTPDLVPTPPPALFLIGGTSGKVALTSTVTPLSGACPLSAAILDEVGFGGTATCFEGAAPAPAPSNTTSVQRRQGGCIDENNNMADFVALLPAPRNGATTPNVCFCNVTESNRVAELDFCNLQHPPSTTVIAGQLTELIYARIFEDRITQPALGSSRVSAQIGFGPMATNPVTDAGWSWENALFNVQVNNDDEYNHAFAPVTPGTYAYASRFSIDGTNWTFCDLNGAGSNSPLVFEPAQLGVMTVTP